MDGWIVIPLHIHTTIQIQLARVSLDHDEFSTQETLRILELKNILQHVLMIAVAETKLLNNSNCCTSKKTFNMKNGWKHE